MNETVVHREIKSMNHSWEDYKSVCKLHTEGKSVSEIVDALDLPEDEVRRYLNIYFMSNEANDEITE